MSRELLQQALGALGTSTWDHTRAVGKQELITALRAALAQPEPEPVAHLYDDGTWIATQTAAGRSGAVRLVDGRYEINDLFDAQLRRELNQAAALLRRHGWRVKEPAP